MATERSRRKPKKAVTPPTRTVAVRRGKAKDVAARDRRVPATGIEAAPRPQPAAARKTSAAPACNGCRCPASVQNLNPCSLPADFDRDRLVLIVRDPYWLHCYWELSPAANERAAAALGDEWHGARPILRLYGLSGQDTRRLDEAVVRDIPVHGGCNNWYVDVPAPPRSFRVDLGYVSRRGRFYTLARSNAVTTPRATAAGPVDGNWADIDAYKAERMLAMSAGFEPGQVSAEIRSLFEERLHRPVGPITPVPGLATALRPHHDFRFQLSADLIVYGTAVRGAHVTLNGEPVRVGPDGTFAVRYRLPDGRQILPAVAASADGLEERTIVLALERNTRELAPVRHDEPED